MLCIMSFVSMIAQAGFCAVHYNTKAEVPNFVILQSLVPAVVIMVNYN